MALDFFTARTFAIFRDVHYRTYLVAAALRYVPLFSNADPNRSLTTVPYSTAMSYKVVTRNNQTTSPPARPANLLSVGSIEVAARKRAHSRLRELLSPRSFSRR